MSRSTHWVSSPTACPVPVSAAGARAAAGVSAATACNEAGPDLGCARPSINRAVAARIAAADQSGTANALDFDRLVDFYYPALFRFALSLARTEHDAADLVQDTFLTWANKGHQLLEPSKVKGWLFTTLHRRFLEGQRHSTRFPELELSESESELPNVEPRLVDQLDARAVVDLLAQVDAQFRAAVALFYLEDYSYQEIATLLEVPMGTVKSRIARGLAQLKKIVLEHAGSADLHAGKEGHR